MSAFKVVVSQRDLAAFKRRVSYNYKKYPKAEYMEGLLIKQEGNKYTIVEFIKLWIEDRDAYRVESNELQFQELRNQAISKGLKIGSIHTHTVCDTALSVGDIDSGLYIGEVIMGVCEVDELPSGRLKMNIDFWKPKAPGELTIICN